MYSSTSRVGSSTLAEHQPRSPRRHIQLPIFAVNPNLPLTDLCSPARSAALAEPREVRSSSCPASHSPPCSLRTPFPPQQTRVNRSWGVIEIYSYRGSNNRSPSYGGSSSISPRLHRPSPAAEPRGRAPQPSPATEPRDRAPRPSPATEARDRAPRPIASTSSTC